MSTVLMERKTRLMPGGIPRYIRCYDSGGVGDRYTVVFTRDFDFLYLGMNSEPFHPQGIGQHGNGDGRAIDRPTSKHLGKRIPFKSLPRDCQKLVRQDYRAIWNLNR